MMNTNKSNLSARPKVRNANIFNEPKVVFEPVEKKMVNFIDHEGQAKSISLISREFDMKMNSVLYFEPSFEELNNLSQMAMHNWLINCRKYEAMLFQLVNMPYFRFWSVMAFNHNIRTSLDSYLIHASRSYRLHPVLKNAEVKVVLSNIHKLSFKVWVRLLVSKESEKNYLSQQYHSQLIRQIVDIPKLISLLQLFAYGSNSEIVRSLLLDFIASNGADFTQELTLVCEDIGHLLARYIETDDGFAALAEEGSQVEMYTLVANVTDIMFSLNKLLLIDAKLASIYVECGLPEVIIAFYSKYFPFIELQCDELYAKGQIVENLYKFLQSQLTLSQASSLLLFHHILQNEFIRAINSTNTDHQSFDALINILNSVLGQKRFCFDYFTRFSFEAEFRTLLVNRELNDQLSIGDVLEYYKTTLKSTIEEYLAQGGSGQATSNADADSTSRFNGLMSFDYQPESAAASSASAPLQEQLQLLPDVAAESPSVVSHIRMDDEIKGKEAMIREMFPDFGDGFVYKCLEHYDFDNEKVLDAILECNLPPHLESLSRELTKSDLLRAQEAAAARQVASERASVQAASVAAAAHDPTAKAALVPAQIFIGKKDKYAEAMAHRDANKSRTIALMERMNAEEEEAKENVKTLIERGKLTRSDLESNIEYVGMYDDEFDDTYENEDVSYDVADETFEDDEEDEDGEDSGQAASNGGAGPSGAGGPNDSRPPPQRQSGTKFAASQRYNKKQFFNKRNFNRGAGKTAAPQSTSQQSHSGEHSSSNQSSQSQQQQQQPSRQSQPNRPGQGQSQQGRHPQGQYQQGRQQQQHHHQPQQRQNGRRSGGPPPQSNNSSNNGHNTNQSSKPSHSDPNRPNESNNNSGGNRRPNPQHNRSQFRNPQSQNSNRNYGSGNSGGGGGGRR